MNDAITTAYRERFTQVCEYIARHLDEPLTLESLSSLACCSPYHFHRQFAAFSGLPLYRYIQWLRLRQASWRLAFNTHERIIDIALDAGFQSPESFSRAFRTAFGKSPRQFRLEPDWLDWHQRVPKMASQEQQTMDVKIVDFPTIKVAMLQHRGSPDLVNNSVATFIAWRKSTGFSPVRSSNTFGIAWDDPATTPPEAFRFDICGSVTEAIPNNDFGVINGEIAGGRYAVGRHPGSLDNISTTVWAMFRDWLPASGETLRDAPVFFHYMNFINDVPEHELLTDIYLPLK
jgi:transcriptional regulator, AraC family